MKVILSLTVEEIEMIQRVLRNERTRLVDKVAHSPIAGYSPAVVQLCRERLDVEALLDRIDKRSAMTVVTGGGRTLTKPIVRALPTRSADAIGA